MNTPLEHDYASGCDLYERFLGSVLFEPYAIDLAGRVADLAEDSVLEMACGTGILTQQLRTRLKSSVTLTATDINPGMLDYAQRKLKHLNGINWQQADIAALPFPDASFHVAVCQFGLMFVPDRNRAFEEMHRVLMEGGLLAVSVWDRMEANPWGVAVQETIEALFPNNPPQFFKMPFSFPDADVLVTLLNANGFDQITIQPVPMECRSNSARSLATGMIEGAPILAEIQERGGSSGPIVDAVATALARFGGDSPFHTTMQAIVATARASG
ncbi:class I SAM-dependent methyltransferase [Nitrospira sp. CMX1]|mgnify:CR=1 FL=1|nr:methyltransferase domain-containing protein [Nitrospira sp.]MBS0167205.1 methyltransferase domain-containing protein [Nitrospira sp.]